MPIEWLHLRHNYPKGPYVPPFVRYILINKPLLHTTRIISPIILSPFTMSKVTKASIKCAAAAQKYREGLEPSAKARYLEKLALIGGEDPYELGILSTDEKLLPAITYPDIVNYLLFTPSPYTADDLKSYKGLQAYNQMCCGWVRDRQARKFGDKCLVKCKVCTIICLMLCMQAM